MRVVHSSKIPGRKGSRKPRFGSTLDLEKTFHIGTLRGGLGNTNLTLSSDPMGERLNPLVHSWVSGTG